MRDSVSHDSWTNDELQWMSACAVYADALPPSSPIAIPPRRGSYERPAIGINDSLTLLRTKGLPRRYTGNYQRPTKASRAKVAPPSRLDTFQVTSNARYKVTPPAPRVPPSPLASSAPASPVSPLRSRIPRLSRAPDPTSGAFFPCESHTATHIPPSPSSKNTEWLYRRPKLTSTSSSCSSSHFQSRLDTIGSPRTRSPLPSCPAGSCPERKHERASGPSNESNTSLKYPPSPPTSYSWSIQHRRYRSEEPQTPSQEVLWEDFDYTPPSPRHMSRPERPKLILQRPSRSTSVSTASSSSSSSRPHTPTLQQYSSQSSSPDDILHLNPESYPRSILTRTSSTSTTKYSPSIMISHNGRKRSGSGSKSVKFVEIPTVHYASIDSEWDIPDEEECIDLDAESDMEDGEGEHENDEEVKPFPPHHDLGSLLGFQGGTKLNLDVDGYQPKDKRLLKSFSLKRDHASPTAASLRRKTEKHSSSVKAAPSRFISGPFALGTLPKPPPPAPPFVMPHAAKGTSVSLRSAPSFESFKSVKSTGGRSILSVKSLRSLPGSLKTGAQGLKDWFKGRRVTVD